MRTILILLAAIGLAATACSGDDPYNAGPDGNGTTTTITEAVAMAGTPKAHLGLARPAP